MQMIEHPWGDLRAQARTEAVRAARRKAQLYADAAGVRLGAVVHIDDVDPEQVGHERYRGHGVVVPPLPRISPPVMWSFPPRSSLVSRSRVIDDLAATGRSKRDIRQVVVVLDARHVAVKTPNRDYSGEIAADRLCPG